MLDQLANTQVRGTIDQTRRLAGGGQGQVFTSKLLPDFAQLVAEGRVWRGQEASATASVTALPTTTALFCLNNNEQDDGLWYVPLAVYAFNSANAAAIDAFSLAANVVQLPGDTTFAQDIAKTSIKNMLGARGGGYNGRAQLDTGVTLTTDDLWFPICNDSGSTAINSGMGKSIFQWIHGLFILPPKSALCIVSTATSTSNTTRKGVIWAEVPKSWLVNQ